jgi:hypothetical protein
LATKVVYNSTERLTVADAAICGSAPVGHRPGSLALSGVNVEAARIRCRRPKEEG